uniref:Uncharacterized protein n=1 Tax=Arundo donax TaxID=35708 RepID=A0A0A9LZM1_ARUDO
MPLRTRRATFPSRRPSPRTRRWPHRDRGRPAKRHGGRDRC